MPRSAAVTELCDRGGDQSRAHEDRDEKGVLATGAEEDDHPDRDGDAGHDPDARMTCRSNVPCLLGSACDAIRHDHRQAEVSQH